MDKPSEGLALALNKIREISVKNGTLYNKYIPVIGPNTNIADFGNPILEYKAVENEFMTQLIQRIGRTMIEAKKYANPLRELQGEELPLGGSIQNLHVNPVKGRRFNVNDFAGLLAKYEADVKEEILPVNQDIQYPVTITRDKLRNAFTSWTKLEELVNWIVDTLYTSAYMDEYKLTKALVSNAYRLNQAIVEEVDPITDEASAKKFVKVMRKHYINFQNPSTKFNAWHLMGGEGRAVKTFTPAEDIVVILNAETATDVDVDVLASAFNMNKTDLNGRVITIDNFDILDDNDEVIFDGSAIKGIICDKRWFKINEQDVDLSDFFNPNNRTWQYYLNVTKGYNHSLFANGVILATALPEVKNTKTTFNEEGQTIAVGESVLLSVTTDPVNTTDPITYRASVGDSFVTVEPQADKRVVKVTGKSAGSATIEASCNSKKATVAVVVEEPAK